MKDEWSNINARKVPLVKYMTAAAFVTGFEDARGGRAWREYADSNSSLIYERGRQLAVYAPWVPSVKDKRRVRRDAIIAFNEALRAGDIL